MTSYSCPRLVKVLSSVAKDSETLAIDSQDEVKYENWTYNQRQMLIGKKIIFFSVFPFIIAFTYSVYKSKVKKWPPSEVKLHIMVFTKDLFQK